MLENYLEMIFCCFKWNCSSWSKSGIFSKVCYCFVDLTKVFDPVIRKGLFNLLQKIWCTHKLQGMTAFSMKEPSSTKAQPQTRSQSRAEWNRAVYFLPRFSASFSPPSTVLRLHPLSRLCVPSHQKWRKLLQPCTPPSKDQGSESTD